MFLLSFQLLIRLRLLRNINHPQQHPPHHRRIGIVITHYSLRSLLFWRWGRINCGSNYIWMVLHLKFIYSTALYFTVLRGRALRARAPCRVLDITAVNLSLTAQSPCTLYLRALWAKLRMDGRHSIKSSVFSAASSPIAPEVHYFRCIKWKCLLRVRAAARTKLRTVDFGMQKWYYSMQLRETIATVVNL